MYNFVLNRKLNNTSLITNADVGDKERKRQNCVTNKRDYLDGRNKENRHSPEKIRR